MASSSRKQTSRKRMVSAPVGPTLQIPPPPQGEGRENLSVEIATSVTWRIQVALFQLQQEGLKTTKRAFVEQLITEGLDRFDKEHARSSQQAA